MQADWTTCTAAGGLPTPPACGDRRLQAAAGLGDDDSGGGAHSPSAEESRGGTSRDAGVSSESESQSRRNLETILAAIRHLEGPAEPLMSLDPDDDDDDDDDDGGDVVGQAASNSLTDAAAATVRMMSSVQTSRRAAVTTLG